VRDRNWHVHAERGENQIVDVPGCDSLEAQFWTRNFNRAHADVTVTDPDGRVTNHPGAERE
jgi:hypothetical protein